MDREQKEKEKWREISEAELQQIHDFALYDLRQKWLEEEYQNFALSETD